MNANATEAFLGVDVGTSSVKVLASSLDGATLASASRAYGHATPSPERVEQDSEAVYAAVLDAIRETTATLRERGARASAVGFSCAMHGIVPVDANGAPLGPLITWMDRRSAAVADAWRADGTAAALYARTGAPVHPMLPSCKLRWTYDNDRSAFEQAAKFVSLKELLVFRWTGEWLVDWGMASGTGLFDVRAREWSDRALDAARVGRGKLARPVAPSTTLRSLRAEIARDLGLPRDIAIVLASSDGALANLGAGAVCENEFALTLGTSGALRSVAATAYLDSHGRTFCYAFDDERFLIGGATSSAGGVLDRIFDLLLDEVPRAERFARAVELAATVAPGADGLVLLPFLSGERAPYWNAHLRGAWIGLDLSHTREHLLRAAFEGVVFALASVFAVVRDRVGPVERIRLSGGLTHAAFVRQMVADAFAVPVVATDHDESSAFGAVAFGALATGALDGLDAVAALVHPKYDHAPAASTRAAYAEAFARYGQCVDAQLDLYAT